MLESVSVGWPSLGRWQEAGLGQGQVLSFPEWTVGASGQAVITERGLELEAGDSRERT